MMLSRCHKSLIGFRYLSSVGANEGSKKFDLVCVGGGIVGVASAREILLRHPNLKIAIVEKEYKLAFHQSGHNSGVVHAGIYYKPGSLKAKLCVEGMHLSYKYFDEKKIPYKKVGKLIVATNKVEEERLQELFQRGLQNKVPDMRLIEGSEIKSIEPFCKGIKAIHSPHTGIVDWGLVTEYYGIDFKNAGGEIFTGFEVKDLKTYGGDTDYPVTIVDKKGQRILSKYVLTCAGLQADKMAALTGNKNTPKIVPFRGEYLLLSKSKSHMVKGNIYPVPDPRFPFLGVHFTPRINGEVWLGPNAVLAFKREGYRWADIHLAELFDALKYTGFILMASRYMIAGLKEISASIFPSITVSDLQRFIPEISRSDVKRGPSGVRAQALNKDGSLVDDFVFEYGEGNSGFRILHCCNAPSPGATSSLAIAKMIADKVESSFKIVRTSD